VKVSLVLLSEYIVVSKKLAKKENYEINISYELQALGLTNVSTSFLNCFPTFGSLIRSLLYVNAGAKSQLSLVMTAFFTFIGMLTVVPLISLIPTGFFSAFLIYSLAPVLMEITEGYFLFKNFKIDFVFFSLTFILCIFMDLINGLIISIMISLLFLLFRQRSPVWNFKNPNQEPQEEPEKPAPLPNLTTESSASFQQTGPIDLNEKFDVSRIREQSMVQYPTNKQYFNQFQIYDLCFCTKRSCRRKCHILVIMLQGYLGFFNAIQLRMQAEQMKDLLILFKKNMKEGMSIRGIIYEMDQVKRLDWTAMIAMKTLVEELSTEDPKIPVYFSQLPKQFGSIFKAMKLPNNIIDVAHQTTKEVIFTLYNDISAQNTDFSVKEKKG